MEYTIYNESLVYYALRNEKGYVIFDHGHYDFGFSMTKINFFPSMDKAKQFIEETKKFKGYENLQIRKVRVIDIGEVNEI